MSTLEKKESLFIETIELFKKMHESTIINSQIEIIVNFCINLYKNNGKILIAGNGGSAADAQHFAGELVSRFNFDRPPLSAIALSTDTSILTAIGNDYGFDKVFSRQVKAHGKKNDIFIAISTSGKSLNIINALNVANEQGLITVGLTGLGGEIMSDLCDVCISVPSESTPRIQECHLVLEHTICHRIEQVLFGHLKNKTN